MNHPPTEPRKAVAVIAAYAAATCVAVVVILLWTGDFETIAAGLLVPLFVIPAIIGYVLTSASASSSHRRRAVYWSLALPKPLFLLSVVLFPSEGARADGADEWALTFLVPLVAAGIVGYVTLEWWTSDESGIRIQRPNDNPS